MILQLYAYAISSIQNVYVNKSKQSKHVLWNTHSKFTIISFIYIEMIIPL